MSARYMYTIIITSHCSSDYRSSRGLRNHRSKLLQPTRCRRQKCTACRRIETTPATQSHSRPRFRVELLTPLVGHSSSTPSAPSQMFGYWQRFGVLGTTKTDIVETICRRSTHEARPTRIYIYIYIYKKRVLSVVKQVWLYFCWHTTPVNNCWEILLVYFPSTNTLKRLSPAR